MAVCVLHAILGDEHPFPDVLPRGRLVATTSCHLTDAPPRLSYLMSLRSASISTHVISTYNTGIVKSRRARGCWNPTPSRQKLILILPMVLHCVEKGSGLGISPSLASAVSSSSSQLLWPCSTGELLLY